MEVGRRWGGGGAAALGGAVNPGGSGIAVIVEAAIRAAATGMAAVSTTATAVASPAPTPGSLSPLKLLHLRFICGVATNAEIPVICFKVHACTTKQVGLALLVQHLMVGMGTCWHQLFGHSNILHYSVPLYNFVAGDRFVNLGENPACPAGV